MSSKTTSCRSFDDQCPGGGVGRASPQGDGELILNKTRALGGLCYQVELPSVHSDCFHYPRPHSAHRDL